MQMGIGLLMKINSYIKVKYIGADDPIALRHGKVYEARVLKLDWYGIVDETNEEYAYPPELFEIVEKAQEDYNIKGLYMCETNKSNDRFIFKVNGKITIEFRNNNIVRKRKKNQCTHFQSLLMLSSILCFDDFVKT